MRYIEIDGLKIGKGCKYIFEDIQDISSGSVTRTETTFSNVDGAEYSNITFQPRAFAIKGHILAKTENELKQLKRDLIKKCNPKIESDLYYFDGIEKYYAKAMIDGLPEFGNRLSGSYFMPFIINVILPKFYWESADEITTPIFATIGRINSSFTFPGVFSERVFTSVISNDGEADVFPIINISCNIPNTLDIEISNETTDKSIVLDYTMQTGERIQIDMYACKITSSINGNLINYVDTLDNFWSMIPGNNTISVLTDNIYAEMKYRNLYIGV